MLFEIRRDLAQLRERLRQDFLEIRDRMRRANTRHHVFTLRVHQEFAVENLLP